MLVRIADYLGDAGKRGDFFRGALRVAAGDHDLRIGILAMDAADGGAGILIGGGGDGAGIEHDSSASVARRAFESPLFELALDSGAVGLGGAAAEILDVKVATAL